MKYKYRYLIIPILLLILLFGLFIKAPVLADYPFYDNKLTYRYSGDNNGQYSRFYDFTINILNFNKTRNTYEFTFEIYYRNLFNDTTYTSESGAEHRPLFHNKLFFTDTTKSGEITITQRVIKSSNTGCASGYQYNLEISYRIRWLTSTPEWSATYSLPNKCNLPPPAYNRTMVHDILLWYNFSSNYFRAMWYLNNSLIHDTGNVNVALGNQRLYLYQLYHGKTPASTLTGVPEYASRYEHFYTRVYTKLLSRSEIEQNFYNPFANYTKDRLLLDYTVGYIDRDLGIWKNKMNDYNSQYFPSGKPWLRLMNYNPKSMLMEELTTTLTISQISTTTFSYITTISEIRDYTNYYCSSLLFIPFAFGLLFYFIERRLILIGIGLGFIFLHLFLGVSYAYFLLGIFIMFLNVILLRYRIIEKE
jgi:hypothetical protein